MNRDILSGTQAHDANRCGNKAARLAELQGAGFLVPDFLVVLPDADIDGPGFGVRLAEAVHMLAGRRPVAVRSSGRDEDGTGQSHAGMYESFLDVAREDVLARIRDVRASAAGARLQSYRHTHELGAAESIPAVIVQRMAHADAAGVAFAANPVTGRTDRVTIGAVRGLGDVLVSGAEEGDSWELTASGRILTRDCRDHRRPVLSCRQLRRVAALAQRVSAHCGRPQDIEWAFAGRRLVLLQSRDITTIPAPANEGEHALWDNSNIVESYGGVTTPLTFSVARAAYADAYRNLGRVIGVSERAIGAHARDYEQMIGLIDGHVYYNLLSWYRLLMLVPGFRHNRRFMEQMMGVTRELPDAELQSDSAGPFAGIRSGLGLARVALRLLGRLNGHAGRVRRFHAHMEQALSPRPLADYSASQLCDYYEELQSQVVPAWDTPLVNDLFCMLFHGVLRALCERWLPSDLKAVHNELLRGESALVSLEPVHRMRRMAEFVRESPELGSALLSGDAARISSAIIGHEGFGSEYLAYLERFGDRCVDELKLESPTLAEDPTSLLQAVAQLAVQPATAASPGAEASRQPSEERVLRELRGGTRRAVFRTVLARARAAVRDRENLRFERTRVYGRVRSIVLELGRRLLELQVLASVDDVFYLELDELLGFVRGTGCSAALAEIARVRRQEFDRYRAAPAPPRRFLSSGPPQLPTSRRVVDGAAPVADGLELSAQACSPGLSRGPVKVVRDPRAADIRSGDILVAARTDPGWVTLFPAAAGIIMERGSLLSHTAIVARELGIPCVVGADGACDWLRDGDWVELDGTAGRVRRLDAAERAA
ncbi:MAG: PEP-utilizing enzyme [Gammaproteobacteria bacterium]|nr:PEP-utilizing enzyme [Gammaproteobacteria bacterium]